MNDEQEDGGPELSFPIGPTSPANEKGMID